MAKREKSTKPNKYVLYEQAVQAPEADVHFMRRVFKTIRGRKPKVLREDFCGTAALCCEWVHSESGASAVGIDLDGPTLEWAKAHNLSKLGALDARVRLIRGNVLDRHPVRADAAAAFNFSYFCLKKRKNLLAYCRRVLESLAEDGIFFLDIYGGPGAMEIEEEETDFGDFTYVWDQAGFNPITGEILCRIHFKLPGGRRMARAFTYDWRLWTIPELSDVLRDAGFADVRVYWEGTGPDGEGNGVFRLSKKGDDSEAYVAYVVAVK